MTTDIERGVEATTWCYRAELDEETGLVFVVESYEGLGQTGPIRPRGESIEDLITELTLMAQDLQQQLDEEDEIVAMLQEAYTEGYRDGYIDAQCVKKEPEPSSRREAFEDELEEYREFIINGEPVDHPRWGKWGY